MTLISLRCISTLVLVLGAVLFLAPLAPTNSAANPTLARILNFTHEIALAEPPSKTYQPRSKAIREYLADIFGVPGLKTSWYDNIIAVEVTGETVTVKTDLSRGDNKVINVCGVISGFVYSNLNVQLDVRKVKILGSSGEVLVFRRGVMDDCPYISSRNPPLQPTANHFQ